MSSLVPPSLRWFEPVFLKILQHEYRAAMRFDSSAVCARLPQPTAEPCQLYVHVPFCEVLCPFCSFHRVRFREGKAHDYFAALRTELRHYHDRGFTFADVYIGGGTPTVLPEALLDTIELIRRLWPVRAIAVETNPNHLHEPLLGMLADSGVSRLSVGVQSFDDRLLRQMDRYEKYGSGAQIRELLAAARGRFRTLNVDMIFDLPNQSLADLERDLDIIEELRVDQVSFYPLMTAPTARRRMEQTLGRPRADRRYQFYERILERMLPKYQPSSAWCFSRIAVGAPAAIDEYIVNQDDYIGVGSGAFSFTGGAMYSTTFSINQYMHRVGRGQSGITQSKQLTLRERMRYDYLVRLFGLELSQERIRRKYGSAFRWLMLPELLVMRLVGATRHERGAIRLTSRGKYYWVLMMAEFFNAVNLFRDQMRLHIREELAEYEQEEVVVPFPTSQRRVGGG
jgi:coproporphyrinogen III oxidase-like Fe-S oxidoreductase